VKRIALALTLALVVTPAWAKKKPKEAPAPAPVPAAPVDPEAWRATPPGPGPERAWTAPVAQVVTLSNGIPVYVVPNPAFPLVSVRLHVGAGRVANPAGKAGLASLTADLLDEGTSTRTASKIASEASGLGAVLTTAGGDESATVSLDALGGDALGPALDLMADVTLRPAFAKAEFARVQAETLAAIEEAKAEPRDAAVRTFLSQLYGAAHPYGTPAIGTTASVKALKVEDVKKLYQGWYHAGNAAFVVSGALTPEEAKTLLDARFGKWAKGAQVPAPAAVAAAPIKTRVVFVEQPGAVQSVLRIGTVGLPRTSPDYPAATLTATHTAGMFSSRINMNLREEKGWSYGAYGAFTDSRDGGVFSVRTSVQADKTAPAVAEVLKELASAAKTPATAADLTVARDNILKSLPGYFETNEATANAFLEVPRFGLGPDSFVATAKAVGAVTPAEAGAAAARWFDPARQLVVVVGPKSVTVDDGKGGTTTVDVVKSLQDLGYEFVAL